MSHQNITGLLNSWSQNRSPETEEALLTQVYGELRRLAQHHLNSERQSHTLQATALVHETYLRLVNQEAVAWKGRLHFFAIAGCLMRRVLVDHARGRGTRKRGAGIQMLSLDTATQEANHEELFHAQLELAQALEGLSREDPQKARIVDLRYFGGLTVSEVAEVLEISEATVFRHWNFAKSWLMLYLRDSFSNPAHAH
ncbi:MAG: sigma-70 family RNA polymerase sigma factor [Deltaproteobacteria bacterium]|nr:sigma-70 family RNA polymerase sigma factor [Deltaproteobacteria bacterium]